MDADVIADLKQFITVELFQQTTQLTEKFATKGDLKGFATKEDVKQFATKEDLKQLASKEDLAKLEQKVDGIQDFLENSNIPYIAMIDDQVQKHAKRITKLERKTA